MAEKDDMKDKNENEETPEEESSTEEQDDVSETSDEDSVTEEDASTEDVDSDKEDSDEAEDASDEDDSDEAEDASDEEDADAARAPEDVDDSDEDTADEGGTSDDDTADDGDDSDEDESNESTEPDEDAPEDDEDPAADVSHEDADAADDVDGDKPVRGYAAYYDHPDHLLAAARHVRDSKYNDFEAYSPFPIHGMDEAMGLSRSWIPWVTFGAGIVGFLTANALQFGMMTFDWPMIIGGKPFAPWPSFVPVMFELTVLVAGVTTALVMLKAAGCFKKADIIDERITNDRFVLWISADDNEFDEGEVESFLTDLNPLEIKRVQQ